MVIKQNSTQKLGLNYGAIGELYINRLDFD